MNRPGIDRLAGERRFGGIDAHRLLGDAEQRKRRAPHHIASADIEECRGTGQGEIALAAGEFVEAVAVTEPPDRQLDGRDHFVGRQRRRHEAEAELAKWHRPQAANTGEMQNGVIGGAHRRQFGGRIGVRE